MAEMGLIFAMLTLNNPRRPDIEPVEASALADTGSVFLVIPQSVRNRLGLDEVAREESVVLADGSRRRVPYVGPIEVRFKNRVGFFGAIVMGDQTLLGAIPMEDMDLVLTPVERRVDVNPESPDIAQALAK
jgi:clan AA aspartic protease